MNGVIVGNNFLCSLVTLHSGHENLNTFNWVHELYSRLKLNLYIGT